MLNQGLTAISLRSVSLKKIGRFAPWLDEWRMTHTSFCYGAKWLFMFLERKTKEEGRHHCNNKHKMPFAELFDNDRQILYMGLQKKAESSQYNLL